MRFPQAKWVMVTVAALLLTQGGIATVRALYEPKSIRAPRESVTNLPVVLGDWQASSDAAGTSGMDEEMLRAVWADDAVTRIYRHKDGLECSVHLAVWAEGDAWMPHPPSMCYPSAGYTETQHQTVALPGIEDRNVGSSRYHSAATGATLQILYWYQMGDRNYMNRDGARKVRNSYWGNRERPPLVKVLMQISDREELADETAMLELASHVFQYIAQL